MKRWQEKEFSQWVYYDDEDGKIIGAIMWGIVGASEWVGTYRNHAVCQVK